MPVVESVPMVKPTIEQNIKHELLNLPDVENQVTIHCKYIAGQEGDMIRIWKSTFLIARDSSHKSSLVHAQKITIYPTWTILEGNETIYFTLIFSGLPKSCRAFDFMENIPEPGGFLVTNIARNNLDVYHVDLN